MAEHNANTLAPQRKAQVEQFLDELSSELDCYEGSERRRLPRRRLVLPVLAMPFDQFGKQHGDAFHAVTRDISDRGIGLLSTRMIPTQQFGLLFQTLRCREMMVLLKVTRCRRVGVYYDIGGEFLDVLINSDEPNSR